jgi:GT2 family glycosyltransferase
LAAAPSLAVAFVVREKFSYALASLERLYRLAAVPFTLYFVDGRYPPALRTGLDAFLADKENVVRLEPLRFVYPSEALNLVVERVTEPYIFLLQNDVLLGSQALARLLAAAQATDADVVAPEVLDLADGKPGLHRDADYEAPVAFTEREGKIHAPAEAAPRPMGEYRRIDYFELHCLLARTSTLRALAPLAPLSMHEHVDLSIALWRRGGKAILEERARVLYAGSPPLPLRDFDCAYFSFRWDLGRAQLSDRYVRARWPIAELFEPPQFIAHQRQALAPEAIASRYDSAFAEDAWPDDLA